MSMGAALLLANPIFLIAAAIVAIVDYYRGVAK
jgi:hypothetical protein